MEDSQDDEIEAGRDGKSREEARGRQHAAIRHPRLSSSRSARLPLVPRHHPINPAIVLFW